MAKGFKHGAGGGTSLNFKVVGGTTQPTNPKENTIWVNTDTKITGWVFSATQPTAPAEGMVWIETGSESKVGFNALKKNGVCVYPLRVSQFVAGVWADKEAKIHQNGTWNDLNLIIDIYVNGQFSVISGFTVSDGTVKNENNMLTFASNGNTYSAASSVEMINVDDIKEIAVVFEAGSRTFAGDAHYGIGVSATPIKSRHTNFLSITNYPEINTGDTRPVGEFVIDVSNVTGNVYLGWTFGGSGSIGTGYLYISKIEMRG